ncbi:MAG: hypothetical protein ACRDQX_07240 [Pseudonocardiaceae bacterium]
MSSREVSGDPEIEDVAHRILDAGLGQGRSVIEPATSAWMPEVTAELRHRVMDNSYAGSGGFLSTLRAQLAGAPRATVLLAAELLFLHVVPLCTVTAKAKRERIGAVRSSPQPPAALPPVRHGALGAPGGCNGGVGFTIQIWG